jgi:hypothetical protein
MIALKLNLYVSLIITIIICLYPCRWSLMSLIIGKKVKTYTSQGKSKVVLHCYIHVTCKITHRRSKGVLFNPQIFSNNLNNFN